MRSMTGFGVGRAGDDALTVVAEVRSVNNRFLELAFRIPRLLLPYETQIREIVQQYLRRGRVSISITEEWKDDKVSDLRLDRGKVLHYSRLLKELAQISGLETQPRLEHLLQIGDFFTPGSERVYEEKLWNLSQTALREALTQLVECSSREGERIKVDLESRFTLIEREVEKIEACAQNQVINYHTKLRQRLEELIADPRLDANRLETEIALAAERLDITEEITRLRSHLSEARRSMREDPAAGKTLNFLLQEMQREANTINAKAIAIEIIRSGVEIKKILEELREQVQNIE